jgi:hypothetical protein
MLNSYYTIEAEITGISVGRIDAVVDAISRTTAWEIPAEGWWTEEHAISIESQAMLRVGERPESFAERLARSTWTANSEYAFGELDYRRMMVEEVDEPRPAPTVRRPFRLGVGVPKPVPLIDGRIPNGAPSRR